MDADKKYESEIETTIEPKKWGVTVRETVFKCSRPP